MHHATPGCTTTTCALLVLNFSCPRLVLLCPSILFYCAFLCCFSLRLLCNQVLYYFSYPFTVAFFVYFTVLHIVHLDSRWTPDTPGGFGGLQVDSTWTFILYLDSTWTPLGFCLDSTWNPPGLHLEFILHRYIFMIIVHFYIWTL